MFFFCFALDIPVLNKIGYFEKRCQDFAYVNVNKLVSTK